MVRRILKDWKNESGSQEVALWKCNHSKSEITICTPQPGWFIGKSGLLYDKYLALLREKLYDDNIQIKFVETDYAML